MTTPRTKSSRAADERLQEKKYGGKCEPFVRKVIHRDQNGDPVRYNSRRNPLNEQLRSVSTTSSSIAFVKRLPQQHPFQAARACPAI